FSDYWAICSGSIARSSTRSTNENNDYIFICIHRIFCKSVLKLYDFNLVCLCTYVDNKNTSSVYSKRVNPGMVFNHFYVYSTINRDERGNGCCLIIYI